MSATLRELIAAHKDLRDSADEQGVIEPSVAEEWDAIDGKIEEKVARTGLHMENEELEIAKLTVKIMRLEDRKRAMENRLRERKEFLAAAMLDVGLERVKHPEITVWIQNNNPSVQVDISPEHLPANFVREVPATFEADKKALLARYKQGLPLPEGVRITHSKSLRFS